MASSITKTINILKPNSYEKLASALSLFASIAFVSAKDLDLKSSNGKLPFKIEKTNIQNFDQSLKGKLVQIKKADFIFYSSCGGAYHVTADDGVSTWDIIWVLWELDSILCP